MPLTDTTIRQAKPKDIPFKIADGQGLYLLVNPSGSRLWRLKYRLHGVEKKLALGTYPQVSLADARSARDAARKQLTQAIDPNVARRRARLEASVRVSNSFASVAEEMIDKKAQEGRSERTLEKQRWLLKLLGSEFGAMPVADIMAQDLLFELKNRNGAGGMKRRSSYAPLPAGCFAMRRLLHVPNATPRNCYWAR